MIENSFFEASQGSYEIDVFYLLTSITLIALGVLSIDGTLGP